MMENLWIIVLSKCFGENKPFNDLKVASFQFMTVSKIKIEKNLRVVQQKKLPCSADSI